MKHKRRIVYALLLGVLLLTEIYIALYVRDRFVRPYLGDVLVTLLVGCAVRVAFPMGTRWLPLYVMLFATGVECLQYIDVVGLLRWENSAFLSTVIGRSFSWWDLVCYATGCLLLWGVDALVAHRRI